VSEDREDRIVRAHLPGGVSEYRAAGGAPHRRRRVLEARSSVAGITLPHGVGLEAWSLEKVRTQNPRIRACLGCLRLFEHAQAANYQILHCSPERLHEIWRALRVVVDEIRTVLAPLLQVPSIIPVLDRARSAAEASLETLAAEVFDELDRLEGEGEERNLFAMREVLCRSIGRVHAFLLDSFAEIAAADPRSEHGADYFLSRKFPEEILESERLYVAIERLARLVDQVDQSRKARLHPLLLELEREGRVVDGPVWDGAVAFLESLVFQLAPKLREVLSLDGVRFYEMAIVDRYAVEVPSACEVLAAVHEVGRTTLEQISRAPGMEPGERARVQRIVHLQISKKLIAELEGLDRRVQELANFVPLWRESVGSRRARWLTDEAR
jgi:hypothetical protein